MAIIDARFTGLANAKAAGEIPAGAVERDESGLGMESGSDGHGVALAEIVHDMAPDAQLYLIRIADETDLEAAKDYCIANGIQVINHSLSWYGFNFFDGAAYSSMTPSPVAFSSISPSRPCAD